MIEDLCTAQVTGQYDDGILEAYNTTLAGWREYIHIRQHSGQAVARRQASVDDCLWILLISEP